MLSHTSILFLVLRFDICIELLGASPIPKPAHVCMVVWVAWPLIGIVMNSCRWKVVLCQQQLLPTECESAMPFVSITFA